ncbi:uncharacterized protein PgNI_07984 [Pyricularia grisea]|uniref:Peptide hydrolase n=1 Tax=Pyricularia grisea TaxID=148305 RepID=A0A6P8B1R2_PYRGI|nr:uncharacterized protein PgNI_07984 [Pyricularia grisea]TLD08754.1 hypothetical protein PgNI_07984 [Pyricularia grisea]
MKNHASMLAALGTIVSAVLSQDLPPLTSDGLRGLITADALMAKAKVLEDCAYATPARNRFVGTTGLDTSLQWVYDTLTALDYYDVKKQKFTVNRGGSASFSVAGKTYTTATFDGSPAGEADGKLVPVANLGCSATDFPSSVSGAIALVARGTCGFADKARFAGAAGAKAVVIYNNVAQGAAAGGLGSGTFPPTVGINQADGQALVAAGQGQEGSVSVTINTVSTYNIIAQTRSGDTANVLQLGAHMDSVEVCPGVNDDGSGSIGILETAIQLAKFQPPKNTVRFSWWSAEEVGLVGSTHYVKSLSQEELDKIRLYLNFDMIASVNWLYAIYASNGTGFDGRPPPPGVVEAESVFQEYFDNVAKLNYTSFDLRKASDHGPFIDAKVPTGGLFAGGSEAKTAEQVALFGGTVGAPSDPENHKVGDNASNVHPEPFEAMTKAIAYTVALYGKSFDRLPPRSPSLSKQTRDLQFGEIKFTEALCGCQKPLAVV